nr:GNAT family protein [Sphingobacterium sp. lm-10]
MKNGKQVAIRKTELADAAHLLQTIRSYLPQSSFIPKMEQELTMTISQAEEWISSFIEKENSLQLVAVYEDQIIGNIELTGSSRKVMAHSAMIGMGMIGGWRNSGLGTALIRAVIDWAQQSPVLELLWLQLYSENELALALYRKMGFVDAGLIKGFFKKDGRYSDCLTMTLMVK